MTEVSGVLLIDKPQGLTSHDVVNKVRRLYNTKKVGHTGTLDPLATGLLVILIGRAAKAAEYLVSDSKRYTAGLKLGLTTDTEDITGKILTESNNLPTQEQVGTVISDFTGDIMQTPPMYSALKIGGQKLVDLARKNITIERESRKIHIDAIAYKRISESEYTLTVDCSKGTYIRTLCADIGARLGCGGVMSALHRVRAGGFSIENSHTIEELEAQEKSERYELLSPTESLFAELEAVKLPAFYEKLCRSGCEIYQNKIKTDLELGTRVRLYSANGEFFALGEVREYENGTAIKSIKTFSL